MSDTESPRPDAPGPPKPPPPPKPAEPEEPAVDLHATPSGARPAAWKDLGPPKIIRPKPEEPKRAGEKIITFLKSRAALQIGGAVVAVLVVVGLWSLFQPKATVESHYGALRLFCQALEAHDAAAMSEICTGTAAAQCEGVLTTIAAMEAAGEASPFADARYQAGGANPGAQATSGYVICEGINGDDFMRIDVNLHRQDDGTWRIAEMGTRSLR